MRRREFITLLGGTAATWSLAARAQQASRIPRIGVLLAVAEDDKDAKTWVGAFLQRLQEAGWVEGRNVQIDYRWAGGDRNRIKAFATDLVGSVPDVIFAGSQPALDALRQATRDIPIVFVQVTDPVGQGILKSLAHPDGNYTGFTNLDFSVNGKLVELLKELVPSLSCVAVIMESDNGSNLGGFHAIERTASSLGVEVIRSDVRNADEIKHSIDDFSARSGLGVIVLASPTVNVNRSLIIEQTARYRLPNIYTYRYFVTSGGLMSYGTKVEDVFRDAASYVDRILRGATPAELPVQQYTKVEIVINLKTAKMLGIDVPPSVLARADEVVE
jgi:putative tryptophan/tyrosine transport system substrate-binding protein